jgi:hypothetical protein
LAPIRNEPQRTSVPVAGKHKSDRLAGMLLDLCARLGLSKAGKRPRKQ